MPVDTDIDAAVEAVAKAKVAEALGGDVIGKIVTEVMNHKDRSYGANRAETQFDAIVRDCVLVALRRAVEARLDGEEVKRQIADCAEVAVKEMATRVVDAFAGDDWRAQLDIHLKDNT